MNLDVIIKLHLYCSISSTSGNDYTENVLRLYHPI